LNQNKERMRTISCISVEDIQKDVRTAVSMRRLERDVITIKRTIDANYDKFKTIGVFFLEKNAVLNAVLAMPDDETAKIAADCREAGVRWRMFNKYLTKIENALLDGCEIRDLSQSEEKLSVIGGAAADDFVQIFPQADGVQVSFAVNGTFSVLSKMNRNGKFVVEGMGVTPETRFTVVNELLPFWEDRYSVALRNENLWAAISVEDPKIGKKGSACVKLYVKENGVLTMDNLAKYTDTTELLRWINP